MFANLEVKKNNVEICDEKDLPNLKNSIILSQAKIKKNRGIKVTTFFGGVFIDQETLKTAGINYPIKLEYYKRINEDELFESNKAKYGVNIVKTEYKNDKTTVEQKSIKYLTNDEKRANYLLRILKENFVTPIELDDIVSDFSKQLL